MAATAEHPVHNVAKAGFGTGTNELYDRARPSYPPAALSHIRNALAASAPLNVVEIGAGTGIFTRALLAHPDWSQSVNQLRAIEPSEGMRDVFAKSVHDPRVSVAEGTFDSTGVDDGWADLVVIAQAFHWCLDYDKASAEFARILKPTGILALIWNLENRDGAPWVAQLRDRIEPEELRTPQFRLGLWRAMFATPSYTARFAPPDERTWSYALTGTRALVLDRAQSKSYIAILPPDDKAAVVRDINAVLDRADGLVWLDQKEGVFEYPYKTLVVIARKK
ncbi:S-adenosyl-L-methionine-dependent methyltransferase [Sparassis crispa]|uniref:S-adenosyl-L-methionine-dependent methyltransferase n=1 Tax=Sparassis crispa TaxID=139825 RepID=A0A401GI89_9APHY|nr:S-adenosyl-L-methionine-dependent methyltransferase [Sparassis crispa]GBE81906.1 S-adenosyl-L-methionine-dependent methyltransferase [Sparassis crispa]